MSLFVNPAQFGEAADLNGYPRDEAADLDAARAEAGVDVVFAPSAGDHVPARLPDVGRGDGARGRCSRASTGPATSAASRPSASSSSHIVRPELAFFGQKDAQQVEVLRRMIADLELELRLVVVPTVRDADGLALSSRNVRLTPEERVRALALPRALATRDAETARAILEASELEVDYVAVAPFDPPTLAAAVRVGSTRLIDNVPLDEER